MVVRNLVAIARFVLLLVPIGFPLSCLAAVGDAPQETDAGLSTSSLGLVATENAPRACRTEIIGAIASTLDGTLCICKKSKDKKSPSWAEVASGHPCWVEKK